MKTHIKTTQMRKLTLLLLLLTGIVNAQIVNIPDANFKAKLLEADPSNSIAQGLNSEFVVVDANSDGEIQVSEALAITVLNFFGSGIIDFSGIENFSNLMVFQSVDNNVVDFHLSGLTQLKTIVIQGNNGTNTVFNFSNLPSLLSFHFNNSFITSLTLTNISTVEFISICNNINLVELNLVGLTSLDVINAYECKIETLSITNSPILTKIDLHNNELNGFQVTNYPLLNKLDLSNNNISDTSSFTNLDNLKNLNIEYNNINNLVLPSLPVLETFRCGYNNLGTINLLAFPSLKLLTAGNCGISNINLSNNPLLQFLSIENNNVSVLDFSNTPLVTALFIGLNPINSLNLSNLTLLNNLNCTNTLITELDLSNNSLISTLSIDSTLITSLDLSNLSLLNSITCSSTLISGLDLSNNPLVSDIRFENNPNLVYINLKSGAVNTIIYYSNEFYNLPNLTYICVDEGDIINYDNVSPTPIVPISSYCSFTPGGNYNTISGNIKLDANNNGCDANDLPQPNIRVNINDGTNTGASFTSTTGDYKFYTQAGSLVITPEIENPSFFNFTPTTATIPFTDNNNNTATQDFCISANGVHPDLEVVLAPITPARPGFDAVYQLIYKNKGNQTLNGVLSLNYDVFRLLFISSNTTPDFNFEGTIDWNFTNLLPFESRSISLTLNVNSPLETPAVNIGDVLNFTATINPISGDELPDDNTFVYNQTVVGSYDPNDITCLEGNNVAPSEIGEYLHYVINFENTGNYPAENVVVKTIVDTTKFDVNSLQLLNTSNPVDARITGNVVEFIFENIQLGGPGGHGHILLKIKSKSSLVAGDAVAKNANIYFDYNAPVDTNLATTVFQSLSNAVFEKDDSIKVSPNPTSGTININSNFNIKKIELYDVQGRVLETQIGETETFDISEKANGIYFLKITTEKGSKVEKVVKK